MFHRPLLFSMRIQRSEVQQVQASSSTTLGGGVGFVDSRFSPLVAF